MTHHPAAKNLVHDQRDTSQPLDASGEAPGRGGHPLLDIRSVPLSGERIVATYRFRCTPDQARDAATFLVHEHTIELPSSVLPDGFLRHEIVGSIEHLAAEPSGHTLCRVSYAAEVASGGFTTLLTLIMGNGSFLPFIQLVDLQLPPSVLAQLPGPRFGVSGVRELAGVVDRPLGATALKPVGASPAELARIASALALGGIDIIKEDDGVSTQLFAPFEDRVERCAAAIAEASAKTGKRCLYFANITGPIESLRERAFFAKEKGAAGVEILPGPMGLDTIRLISGMDDLGIPVMSHCAWQGALCREPNPAFSIPIVFGLLPRLAGADLSIMPGFGGRFDVPRDACLQMTKTLQEPVGALLPSLPMPGGGVTFERLPDFIDVFGHDCVLLMSGALFTKPDLTAASAAYMAAIQSLR